MIMQVLSWLLIFFLGLLVFAIIVAFIATICLFATFKTRWQLILFIPTVFGAWLYFNYSTDSFIDTKRIFGRNVLRHEKMLYLGEEFKRYLDECNVSLISNNVWCNGFIIDKPKEIKEILDVSQLIPCNTLGYKLNDQLRGMPLNTISGKTVLIIEDSAKEGDIHDSYRLVFCYDGTVLKYYNDERIFKDFYSWNKTIDASFK